MRTRTLIAVCLAVFTGMGVAQADPPNLFTRINYSGSDNSPPPPDALTVYDTELDIRGIAAMPAEITVRIPRKGGDLVATILRERFDRREGFVERDPVGCNSDRPPPGSCDLVPNPDLPENEFSYSWVGRGGDYDLRLSVHRGNVVGILVGPAGRFAMSWYMTKELRLEYFNMDDDLPTQGVSATDAATMADVPVMSAAAAQSATLAKIGPRDLGTNGVSNAQLDLLFLITEEARQQAGGNPGDCRDTAGVMNSIHARIDQMNEAFARSQIPAQIGAVTVTRLYGYTLIPHAGNNDNIGANRTNITTNPNIRAYRNAVGADVVSVLFDKQTNLGPCGVANVQRHGCTYPTPTSGCDVGSQFAEWSTYLDTIECTVVDVPTHELGHVLGAEHHYFGGGIPRTAASFPYSYGYGYGAGQPNGFETIMSQRFNPDYFPVRLLQFSNPDILYAGWPTGVPAGSVGEANNALTLTNLIPGTAAFRARPNVIFASGFDEQIACPGISY
jgi:hypothetical protein